MNEPLTHNLKRAAVKKAEGEGLVADSLDVRAALIKRFKSKEITFEQMQEELKRIKSSAKQNGKLTRAQAYDRY